MWPNKQETVDLVIFTEKILNEKLYFFWVVYATIQKYSRVKLIILPIVE